MNAPTRAQFLEQRRAGIGGTDIAVLLGLSPHKTQLELWLEKTGRSEPQVSPDAEERMYWGTVLEDVVARRYAEVTNRKIQRVNDPLVSGVVRGNIDRAIINPAISGTVRFKDGRLTTDRILEVKTANAYAASSADWGAPGTDEVPQHYWLQVQTYLGLSHCEIADVAVLFGGQKFVIYQIVQDASVFSELMKTAADWWERHVVADIPPEASSEADARRLWASHVANKDKIVDVMVADAVRQMASIKECIATAEKEEQRLRDIVLPAFGDAESISYMGKKLATWKQNKSSAKTDWKAVAAAAGEHLDEEVFALIRDDHTTQTEGARVLRLNTKEQ